jgi:hypothetical protein
LLVLLRRCHDRLRGTRGIALSMASFDAATSSMSWVGVGSVVGILVRGVPEPNSNRDALLLRGGTVGRMLPQVVIDTIRVDPGDVLLFATDGIDPDFSIDVLPPGEPQRQADYVLQRRHKGHDDGLVLVAAFHGRPT